MTVRADGDQHELQQLRCWRFQVCMPNSLQAQSQGTQKHVNNTPAVQLQQLLRRIEIIFLATEVCIWNGFARSRSGVFQWQPHCHKPTIFIKTYVNSIVPFQGIRWIILLRKLIIRKMRVVREGPFLHIQCLRVAELNLHTKSHGELTPNRQRCRN